MRDSSSMHKTGCIYQNTLVTHPTLVFFFRSPSSQYLARVRNILVHSWSAYGCLEKLSAALHANINLYVMQRKTNHFRNEKENNTKPSTWGSKHHLWIMTVHQTYCGQVGINLNKLNNVFVMKCEIRWMILINGWIGKEKTKRQNSVGSSEQNCNLLWQNTINSQQAVR